jgi:hypothetical protein
VKTGQDQCTWPCLGRLLDIDRCGPVRRPAKQRHSTLALLACARWRGRHHQRGEGRWNGMDVVRCKHDTQCCAPATQEDVQASEQQVGVGCMATSASRGLTQTEPHHARTSESEDGGGHVSHTHTHTFLAARTSRRKNCMNCTCEKGLLVRAPSVVRGSMGLQWATRTPFSFLSFFSFFSFFAFFPPASASPARFSPRPDMLVGECRFFPVHRTEQNG